MERNPERRCETCVFYAPIMPAEGGEQGYGRCRRFPPTNGNPHVNTSFWCGEHRTQQEDLSE